MKHRALACATLLACATATAGDGAEKKPQPVKVALRAAPRVAPAPATVVFTVELVGGQAAALSCLTLHWEWGDGTESTQEGECRPGADGQPALQRTFQATHEYRKEGRRAVELTVRKGAARVGVADVNVVIGAGRGKTRLEYRQPGRE